MQTSLCTGRTLHSISSSQECLPARVMCINSRSAISSLAALRPHALRKETSTCRQSLHIVCAVKKERGKTVVASKTLVCVPGSEKRVMQMCKDIVAFSTGRMSNPSNGILEFNASQDQFEPHVFHMWERYDSNASLGLHNTTPEYKAFMERLQTEGLVDGPVGMVLYEWKDGKLGQASMQGGPKGEGGLDDATGASGMAGGSGYKQTSPVVNLGKIRRGDEGDSFGMGYIFPWLKKKLTGKD